MEIKRDRLGPVSLKIARDRKIAREKELAASVLMGNVNTYLLDVQKLGGVEQAKATFNRCDGGWRKFVDGWNASPGRLSVQRGGDFKDIINDYFAALKKGS